MQGYRSKVKLANPLFSFKNKLRTIEAKNLRTTTLNLKFSGSYAKIM